MPSWQLIKVGMLSLPFLPSTLGQVLSAKGQRFGDQLGLPGSWLSLQLYKGGIAAGVTGAPAVNPPRQGGHISHATPPPQAPQEAGLGPDAGEDAGPRGQGLEERRCRKERLRSPACPRRSTARPWRGSTEPAGRQCGRRGPRVGASLDHCRRLDPGSGLCNSTRNGPGQTLPLHLLYSLPLFSPN